MNYTEQLDKAIEIATLCHSGQFDKNGKPYILHPLRVMFKMDSMYDMIAAVMHDVIEDSSDILCSKYPIQSTIESLPYRAVETLKCIGFDLDIIITIALLSKNMIYPYSHQSYVDRIKKDRSAINIKIADLEDNMDFRRLPSQEIKDWDRVKKYYKLWLELKALRDEVIKTIKEHKKWVKDNTK